MESGEVRYPKPVVSDVNLKVKQGELCAIVGRVGSGKSTLCSAILNEVELGEGSKITVKGKIAFAAQSPWILNQTVRENILFGLPYEEEKYKKIIKACQLTHDLSLLDDGDMTEIGERGINLSGGQKQRISIARAAYADADLIILDDPLSALDPEVAKKLFEECILGIMQDKTRFFVTNQLQCLPKCDSIVALGRGRVIEQGTYEDLEQAQHGEVHRLLKEMREASEKSPEDESSKVKDEDGEKKGKKKKAIKAHSFDRQPSTPDSNREIKEAKALLTKEEREVGSVKLQVYLKYIKAGGGILPFMLVFTMFILSAGVSLLTSIWVSLWTADVQYQRWSESFYIGMYALSAILLGVFTFFRSYFLAKFGISASNRLHHNLLASILSAPMSFFDTTPTGRILSRFSKDMHSVDQELSDFIDFTLFMIMSVVFTLGTIIFATPYFAIALVPILFIYIRILNYFREVSRETKRLESLTRSPVYAHFSETLGGLSTIRAYGESKTFMLTFDHKLDVNTQSVYNNKAADRWLAVRLELLGALIAGLAAIFSIQVALSGGSEQFASLAGLSLTYAIQVTSMMTHVVRMLAQVEAAMNSCERIFYYSEHIPQEAAFSSAQLEKDAGNGDSSTASSQAVVASGGKALYPPPEWPQKGEIVLDNLFMRYRTETPLVLKGLNVTIKGGERVGVVGRTGSGKSSLLLCLMRIVEPELNPDKGEEPDYTPPLTLDGVDVLRIGLKDLRTQLGIIPQNPVLFSGTIRSNMDPFDDYTDEQIWQALEQCGMRDTVLGLPEELAAPVAEYGENLSQGQRQLLCLGRALLKKCRVLLLDEATSSVDFETDREIQRTIRSAFSGSTVLTIAHRVDTIMDSDKILVMKDGVAAEFAPPQELLQDRTSEFAEIVHHSQAENA